MSSQQEMKETFSKQIMPLILLENNFKFDHQIIH